MMNTSVLQALLKRLEAQQIWKMSYAGMGGLLNSNNSSSGPQPSSSAAGSLLMQTSQFTTTPLPAFTAAPLTAFTMSPMTAFSMAAATPPEPDEWYTDPRLSANDALKLLVNRIQHMGPVKQRHLQALYQRCKTAEELEKALKLTRLNYLARGELKQHKPFSHKTSQVLIHQALNVGAPEVAKKALKFADEFGLSHDSYKEFHPLIIYYSKQGDLQRMFEVFEFMKVSGRRPGPETCYILVKGCVDQGRPDLAELVIREFEQNGVRVRDGTKLYLEQNRDKAATVSLTMMSAAAAVGAAQ